MKRQAEITDKNIIAVFEDQNQGLSQEADDLIADLSFFRSLGSDLKNIADDNQNSPIISTGLSSLKYLVKQCGELLTKVIESNRGLASIKLAVIGDFSSGKSTFINSLLGEEICPMKVNPTTSSITRFVYGEKEEVFSCHPGGKKEKIEVDSYFKLVQHETGKTAKTKVYALEYHYPFKDFKHIELYDTPGFNNSKNENDENITRKITEIADVIFFISDLNKGAIGEDQIKILEGIRCDSPLSKWYLIINKSDLKDDIKDDPKSSGARIKIANYLMKKHGKLFADRFIYSAKEVLDNNQKLTNQEQFSKYVYQQIQQQIAEEVSEVSINLTLKKKGRYSKKYELNYQGKNLKIKSDDENKFISVRDEIIELLQELMEGKDEFIKNDLNKQTEKYRIDRRQLLDQLKKILTDSHNGKPLDSDKLGRNIQLFIEKMDTFHQQREEGLIKTLRNNFRGCFQVVEVSNEEKSHWIDPWYKIVIGDRSQLQKIKKLNYLDKLVTMANKAGDYFAEEYDCNNLWNNEHEDHLRSMWFDALSDDLDGAGNALSGKYFENKKKARSALKFISTECISWDIFAARPVNFVKDTIKEDLLEHKGKISVKGSIDEKDYHNIIKKIDDAIRTCAM